MVAMNLRHSLARAVQVSELGRRPWSFLFNQMRLNKQKACEEPHRNLVSKECTYRLHHDSLLRQCKPEVTLCSTGRERRAWA